MKCFVMTLLMGSCLFSSTAWGETYLVGGSGADFDEIDTALLAINDGDVLLVRAGTYRAFVIDNDTSNHVMSPWANRNLVFCDIQSKLVARGTNPGKPSANVFWLEMAQIQIDTRMLGLLHLRRVHLSIPTVPIDTTL